MRAYYLDIESQLYHGLSGERITAAYRVGQCLLWVDVSDTTDEDSK